MAPRSSAARAAKTWEPSGTPMATKLQGGDVSVATTAPSTRNSTRATLPSASEATAENGTGPERRRAPVSGEVSATEGRMFGGATRTVTTTGAEVVTAPRLSVT